MLNIKQTIQSALRMRLILNTREKNPLGLGDVFFNSDVVIQPAAALLCLAGPRAFHGGEHPD